MLSAAEAWHSSARRPETVRPGPDGVCLATTEEVARGEQNETQASACLDEEQDTFEAFMAGLGAALKIPRPS